MGRLNLLLAASATVKAAWIGLVAFIVVTPHYVLHGPVEAVVGLTWYRLSFLGRPLVYPALDTLTVYTLAVIIAAAIAVEAIALSALHVAGRPLSATLRGFVVSSALVLLVASSILTALASLEAAAVGKLAQAYTYATSAGTIVLGKEEVAETTALAVLRARLPHLLATLDTALLLAWYIGYEATSAGKH